MGQMKLFLRYTSNQTIQFRHDHSSDTNWQVQTNRVFRDPSAWYHIVAQVDTTHGTVANRVRLYVNGVQETDLSTANYPAQNEETFLNKASATVKIGQQAYANSGFFDGYMTEFVFLDGLDHAASFFGEFDSDTPTIWKPKNVSGFTFGTNGFYLNVPGASTGQNANGMGGDSSGNNNHFASSGLSAVDRVTDTCTNNFATLNSVIKGTSDNLSEGNLKGTESAGSHTSLVGTIGVSSGKWYFEAKANTIGSAANATAIGVTSTESLAFKDSSHNAGDSTHDAVYTAGAEFQANNSQSSYGNSYSAGDIIGVAMDLDNQKLYFSKNGTFQNSGDPTSGSTGTGAKNLTSDKTYVCMLGVYGGTVWEMNFGGGTTFSISSGNSDANGYGNFEYSVPSGYFSLNTKNLAEYG